MLPNSVADFFSCCLLCLSSCPQPCQSSATCVPLCCSPGSAGSVLALRRAYDLGAFLQADEGMFWVEVQKRQVVPQLHISNFSFWPPSVSGIDLVPWIHNLPQNTHAGNFLVVYPIFVMWIQGCSSWYLLTHSCCGGGAFLANLRWQVPLLLQAI